MNPKDFLPKSLKNNSLLSPFFGDFLKHILPSGTSFILHNVVTTDSSSDSNNSCPFFVFIITRDVPLSSSSAGFFFPIPQKSPTVISLNLSFPLK